MAYLGNEEYYDKYILFIKYDIIQSPWLIVQNPILIIYE